MTVFDDILEYADYCLIVNARLYLPIMISSIGSHILNYKNKARIERPNFYTHCGRVPDLRSNIFIVCPPGYGKTFIIRFFTDPDTGILKFCPFPVINPGKVTEKGLIGGWTNGEREFGEAELYPGGLFGMDEFDYLLTAGKAEHSANMENSLLDLLDSGVMRYRMGTQTPVEYRTFVTVFAGTQSERFSLSSGLARRMTFIDMSPDQNTIKQFMAQYNLGVGIKPDMEKIVGISSQVTAIWENFNVQNITVNESYKQARDQHFIDKRPEGIATDHIEQFYLDRIAFGYTLMKQWRGEQDMNIFMDNDLFAMLSKLKAMRTNCFSGAGQVAISHVLGNREWGWTEAVREISRKLSTPYDQVCESLKTLDKGGFLEKSERLTEGAKKKTTYIKLIAPIGAY